MESRSIPTPITVLLSLAIVLAMTASCIKRQIGTSDAGDTVSEAVGEADADADAVDTSFTDEDPADEDPAGGDPVEDDADPADEPDALEDIPQVFPTLTSIELVDLEEGEQVIPGSIVTVRVLGTDMGDAMLTLEAYGVFEETEEVRVLETSEVGFEVSVDGEVAVLHWTVAGDILAHQGNNEIYFRAIHRDQILTSPSVFVAVEANLAAIRVYYEDPFGTRELHSADSFPIDRQLVIVVDAYGLVGSVVSLEVHYVGVEDLVVDTIEKTTESTQVDFVHQVDTEELGELDTLTVYFRAVADPDLEAISPTVTGAFSGMFHCTWADSSGNAITHETTVTRGTIVTMRVWAWGLDGRDAKFELWEQDDGLGSDDWVADYYEPVVGGVAEHNWTATFIDDGLFDETDELFFRVRLAGGMCYSGIIYVPL